MKEIIDCRELTVCGKDISAVHVTECGFFRQINKSKYSGKAKRGVVLC